ncbi:MAG: hypothetical protein LBK97_03870 [Prevotellaceae bacterium]|jgi:hypothetical protein|nr:hypothetical protein [Prevotellaceae bacterium]
MSNITEFSFNLVDTVLTYVRDMDRSVSKDTIIRGTNGESCIENWRD